MSFAGRTTLARLHAEDDVQFPPAQARLARDS
jgi:hypothetical protein